MRRSAPILGAVVGIALVALGWNFLALRARIVRAFAREDQLQAAMLLVTSALKLELDEVTALRVYAAGKQPASLGAYAEANRELDATLSRLRRSLSAPQLAAARAAVGQADATDAAWRRVAERVVSGSSTGTGVTAGQLPGSALVDRFRGRMFVATGRLGARIAIERGTIVAALQRLFAADLGSLVVIVALFAAAWTREVRFERSLASAHSAYRAERRVAEQNASLASRLQELFMADESPQLAGIALSSWYAAATEGLHIGGDWFNMVELDDDRFLFGVGDVAGHGIEAALTMGKLRRLILTAALVEDDPAQIFRRLNAAMIAEGTYATALLGVLSLAERRVTYAIAGHPPAVLVGPDRSARFLETGAMPLGVATDVAFTSLSVSLEPGARLILYTDGLLEFDRSPIEAERVLLATSASLAGYAGSDLAERLVHGVVGERTLRDDVAVLCLSFLGVAVPASCGSRPSDSAVAV